KIRFPAGFRLHFPLSAALLSRHTHCNRRFYRNRSKGGQIRCRPLSFHSGRVHKSPGRRRTPWLPRFFCLSGSFSANKCFSLPAYPPPPMRLSLRVSSIRSRGISVLPAGVRLSAYSPLRSEERRVGKD